MQRRGGATYQSTSVAAAAAASNPLGYDHYSTPNDLVASSHLRRPAPLPVYLPPAADRHAATHPPRTTVYVTPKSDIRKPATGLQTPFGSGATPADDDTFRTPIAVFASTPAPITANEAYNPQLHQHYVQPGAVEHLSNHIDGHTSTPRPLVAIGTSARPESATVGAAGYGIHPTTYRPKLSYVPAYDEDNDQQRQTNSVRPIFDRNNALRHRHQYDDQQQQQQRPLVASNALGSGYDPQYPAYDGVSQTASGFQYYLPRQYHEEDSSADGQHRAGSFGYVDPFGIRRVVYYNASPERGFEQRKNNRFVGFGATPYDPRPL